MISKANEELALQVAVLQLNIVVSFADVIARPILHCAKNGKGGSDVCSLAITSTETWYRWGFNPHLRRFTTVLYY